MAFLNEVLLINAMWHGLWIDLASQKYIPLLRDPRSRGRGSANQAGVKTESIYNLSLRKLGVKVRGLWGLLY
jgi:hypothetical protein